VLFDTFTNKFTKLLFSFSDVLKTTNCTFQEVDHISRLTVGIAVYDEYFSCMCAAEFWCALDVFARHTSDANCKPDLPLSRHLRSTGHHDSFGKLKVTIIDHNPKWDDKSRQERESFWIRKLKTLSPNGINEKK
jgi:hypothetical protein